MNEFITIMNNYVAEVTEKKSKFIANVFHIESKEEAEEKIKEIKKVYYDARHNCIAYRVLENETIIERQSDDGEPSGTAGAPMLNIIKKQGLCNILVIVTRYFGGILLGTGGLVRCYSDACMKSIEIAEKVKQCIGIEINVEVDYSNIENFKYYCKKNQIFISEINYSDIATFTIQIQENKKENIINDINEKKIEVRNFEILSKKIITVTE